MTFLSMKNKKGIVWTEVGLWILLAVGLVLVIAGILLLSGKLNNLLEAIRNILSFGR